MDKIKNDNIVEDSKSAEFNVKIKPDKVKYDSIQKDDIVILKDENEKLRSENRKLKQENNKLKCANEIYTKFIGGW